MAALGTTCSGGLKCCCYQVSGAAGTQHPCQLHIVIVLPQYGSNRLLRSQVPPERDSHSAVLLGERMIIFGGDQGGGRYLSDTWAYDVARNEWAQLRVSVIVPSF